MLDYSTSFFKIYVNYVADFHPNFFASMQLWWSVHFDPVHLVSVAVRVCLNQCWPYYGQIRQEMLQSEASFSCCFLWPVCVCMLLMRPYVLDALCASLKLQRNSCSLSLDTWCFVTLHDVNCHDPNNKQQIWRPTF